MLSFDDFDTLTEPIVELYRKFEQRVLNDIARRLVKVDMTSAAAWQMTRLTQSGLTYEQALEELSKLTGKSERVLTKLFKDAGIKTMRFDDAIYRAAGLKPLPLNLSPAMQNVLVAGLRKTGGFIKNLTLSTAMSGQDVFLDAADRAYLEITSGAFSYDQAIRQAVKDVADQGLSTIQYAGGRRERLDVSMRRTVLTGVAQTTAELQLARADEMGVDLLQMSAHVGARNKGVGAMNHESWQGGIYSKSGKHPKYAGFVETTGYGTATGFAGINCRHSVFPFFEGISENAYKQATLDEYADQTVTYNGKEMSVYEATQRQREIERKIREWKRRAEVSGAAGLDNSDELAKVRQWQGIMRDFIEQTELRRQYVREQI